MSANSKQIVLQNVPAPAEVVQMLRKQVHNLEQSNQWKPSSQWKQTDHPPDQSPISSGCQAFDQILPLNGFRRGSLVEWLADGCGNGAGMLAMQTAAKALCNNHQCTSNQHSDRGGVLVVMDRLRWFYPPAAVQLGIDLSRLILVRARSAKEELWALDQVLRCEAVSAVWAPLYELDPHSFRRLQLAAEQGGGIGLLLRPESIRGAPSWADVQLHVQPLASSAGWRWQIELLRCRGHLAHRVIQVQMNEVTGQLREVIEYRERRDETVPMHLVSQLAHPKTADRSALA